MLYKKFISAMTECCDFYSPPRLTDGYFTVLSTLYASKAAEYAFNDYLKTEGLKPSLKISCTLDDLESAFYVAVECYLSKLDAKPLQKNVFLNTCKRLCNALIRPTLERLTARNKGFEVLEVEFNLDPYQDLTPPKKTAAKS